MKTIMMSFADSGTVEPLSLLPLEVLQGNKATKSHFPGSSFQKFPGTMPLDPRT